MTAAPYKPRMLQGVDTNAPRALLKNQAISIGYVGGIIKGARILSDESTARDAGQGELGL